ncbi:carbon-nitrogen hydrolase [Clavulina sp. PMI_390]|nr:carbon-nitrogen hydrolase [Clavulina sp. PMI_390]
MAARIALVQFDPKLAKIPDNIAQAEKLTQHLQPNTLDLLCFPEMAFTGYSFPDLPTITPFLESPTSGPTFTFCSALAKRLSCHIIAGFPERVESTPSYSDSAEVVAANSAMVVNPQGELIHCYRKTNLFMMDKPWAQAGTGLAVVDLPPPLGRTALAICMDLNPISPGPFTVSTIPYEVADFVLANECRTLVAPCNWLDPGTHLDRNWCLGTVNYWTNRLYPLWADPDEDVHADEDEEDGSDVMSTHSGSEATKVETEEAGEDNSLATDAGRDVLAVICNRSGTELGTTFAGTSTLFKMVRGKEPEVVGLLRRDESSVRVYNIERSF